MAIGRVKARHWHVLGAGAIGCLFAVRLRGAGCQLTLVTREAPSDTIAITMVNLDGDSETRFPVSAAADEGVIDHLLVTTKAYDVAPAVCSIAHRLSGDSEILVLANGMGFATELQAARPDIAPYYGTTTEGAYRSEPTRIHHTGQGATLIGRTGQGTPPDWFESWRQANANCSWEPHITTALWRKLAINCVINPLTAVNNCRNGDLLEHEALRKRVDSLSREIVAISEAAGYASVARDLASSVETVITGTSSNYSSMLQDIRAGRRTEIDYLTGHLLEVASAHGIAAPENLALMEELKDLGS